MHKLMKTTTFDVLGVMSGTSLDGIDLAYVQFEQQKTWRYKLLQCSTVPYPKFWQEQLSHLPEKPLEALQQLDVAYTAYLGEVIAQFCLKHQLPPSVFISSHGHTALHQPVEGVTYQLGNLKSLATATGRTVVCDFRTQDVALGGQGAPLVPVGDKLLFSTYAACLNLGGFANVSIKTSKGIKAFDIAAVNTVLNSFAQQLGQPYDDGGTIAKSGQNIPELSEALQAISFYHKSPPKSLGVEWVQTTLAPLFNQFSTAAVPDVLHTYTQHIAAVIGDTLPRSGAVLVTGGGAFNSYLMHCIQQHTTAEIVVPSKELISFKEAVVFAFLGVLHRLEIPNCLAEVTGAEQDHVSGKIFFPSK